MKQFENRLLNWQNQDDNSENLNKYTGVTPPSSVYITLGLGSVSSLLRFDFGSASIFPFG